jgi:hypothetical protein
MIEGPELVTTRACPEGDTARQRQNAVPVCILWTMIQPYRIDEAGYWSLQS